MVGKAGVWAHFGSWNFERADIWNTLRKEDANTAIAYMMKNFNYSEQKAEGLYYDMQAINGDQEANNWIAPWPNYFVGQAACQSIDSTDNTTNAVLICGNYSLFLYSFIVHLNLLLYDININITRNNLVIYKFCHLIVYSFW